LELKDNMRTLRAFKCFAVLLLRTSPLLLAPGALAQYSISWFSLDGGGGSSTGTTYVATGTVGQSDAGRMTGTNFTVEGGFWSIIAAQTPGAPLLSVARQGAGVRIFWLLPATGFLLDHSPTITGSWSQVSFPYNTNSTQISVTISAPVGNRFYRLRKP
jgi:hypothetical protein